MATGVGMLLLYTLRGPNPFESGRREVELPLPRRKSAQAAALQAGSQRDAPALRAGRSET